MQKGLVRFKFVSLRIDLNDPPAIVSLYHQVRDEKGVVIAEGTTDGQGCTVYISRDRGAVLHVYVKSMVTGRLKHKYTHVIRDKKATVEIMSSKILLDDIPLLKHTGDKGKYKRHVHEVKAGETLSGLAKKYNTTVALFMSVNKGIKSADKIAVGQKLLIPPKGMSQLAKAPVKAKSPPPSSAAQATSPNTTQSNTVQPSSTAPSSGAGSSLPTSSSSSANTPTTPSAPASGVSTSQPSTGAGSPSPAAPAIVPMQTTSASSGNPVAVVSGQACVCRAYDLIWGAKVSCDFRRKVVQIAEELWPSDPMNMANNLMACMALETGGTFSPTIGTFVSRNLNDSSDGGYIGLIQFGKLICQDLGITRSHLKTLTNVEQLTWVRKRFSLNNVNQKINNLTDMYLIINYPNSLLQGRNSANDILYRTQAQYHDNPSFMKEDGEFDSVLEWRNVNGKQVPSKRGFEGGRTYIWEVTEEVNKWYKKGGENKNGLLQCGVDQVQTSLVSQLLNIQAGIDWLNSLNPSTKMMLDSVPGSYSVPYHNDANSLRTANTSSALATMDCSELVSRYFSKIGFTQGVVQKATRDWYDYAEAHPERLKKQPASYNPIVGDIFLWKNNAGMGHTGVVVGVDTATNMITTIEAIHENSFVGSGHEGYNLAGVVKWSYAKNSFHLIGHHGNAANPKTCRFYTPMKHYSE